MMRPFTMAVLLAATAWAMAQGDPNLLSNPGFEEAPGGKLQGWKPSCTGGSIGDVVAAGVHTGAACGHIVKVNDGKSHVAALAHERVPVEGGAEYTLSGWGRGEVPAGNAALFLYEYDAEGKWLGNFLGSTVPRTDHWTPLRAVAKIEPTCATVEVRFEIYGNASQGEAWVDDVYFGCDTTAPAAPGAPHVDPIGDNAHITWGAPIGETPAGYQVYRAPFARFVPAPDSYVGFTQGTDFGDPLRDDYAQWYAVVAVDAALNASTPVFCGPVRPELAADVAQMAVWTAGYAKRQPPALPLALPRQTREIALEMARGEYESAQVLVGAPRSELRGVTVQAGDLRGPDGAAIPAREVQVLRQEYVQVTGAAGWVPDPLLPAEPTTVGAGQCKGWWLLVHTPEDTVAGEYQGPVTVRADGQEPVTVALSVKVWPVTVPAANHYGGSWGVWGGQMAEQERVTMGSERYAKLYRQYLDFFLEHRMVPRELPAGPETDDGARWLDDPRVSSFIIGTPAGWSKVMDDAQVEQFSKQCAYLRDRGWLTKGYIYNFDEPEPGSYAVCADMAEQIRKAGKDIAILLTEQPEEGLIGSVDIWCPALQIFADTEERCQARREAGERLWWYVCLAPQPPWPNYLLSNDPIDGRVLSWLQVKHHIGGELYWAVTCFPNDVWTQPAHPNWPGDGYLCYPGAARGIEGPVTCIRAEVVRDAKEDIELIWLLRDLAQKRGQTQRAEAVIGQALQMVCPSFTQYAKDEATIAAARKSILEQIVALQAP